MKKMLIILVLGLLVSGNAFAITPGESCKQKVVDMLLTPGTAKFVTFTDRSHLTKEQKYYAFEGKIDFQNLNGALIRESYNCTMKKTDNGSFEWEALNIGDTWYFARDLKN